MITTTRNVMPFSLIPEKFNRIMGCPIENSLVNGKPYYGNIFVIVKCMGGAFSFSYEDGFINDMVSKIPDDPEIEIYDTNLVYRPPVVDKFVTSHATIAIKYYAYGRAYKMKYLENLSNPKMHRYKKIIVRGRKKFKRLKPRENPCTK